MEDEYELVSKEYIKNLKEENSRLKNEIEELKKNKSIETKENEDEKNAQSKSYSEIIFAIQEEGKKERELIINQLNTIQDLNEKSLTSYLSKSDHLESRLEDIVSSMKSLLDSLNQIIVEVSETNEDKVKQIIESISETTLKPLQIKENIEIFDKKLDDIELFMQNLRILLSYVKPTDLTIDKAENKN